MKYNYKFYLIAYVIWAHSALIAHSNTDEPNLLHRVPVLHAERTKNSKCLLYCDRGFTLTGGDKKNLKFNAKYLSISMQSGKIFCNETKIKSEKFLIHPHGQSTLQGKSFDGFFVVTKHKHCYEMVHYHVGSKPQSLAWHVNSSLGSAIDFESPVGVQKQNAEKSAEHPEYKFNVRVLLESKDDSHTDPWVLKSDQGFIIRDSQNPAKKYKLSDKEIKVGVHRTRGVQINGKYLFDGHAYIMPINQLSTLNQKQYHGAMWIYKDTSSCHIINCVGIEEYVACVLCTESWPGWPMEVNKVFAIASRTYAIAMIQDASLQKRPYHLKNTNAHQTYTGKHARPELVEAVAQTKGLFLTHNNKPITAMFDVCCGGIIPAKIAGIDFKKAPYLARNYPCTHCKVCKVYSWKAEYDLSVLESHLKKSLEDMHKLKDLRITKKDPAGLVQQLSVKSHYGFQTITGKKVNSLLNKDLKSFCYTLRHHGNKIHFNGRGYGHHLGLCQWGAKEMVTKGSDYKQVLSFYYPGTSLMRLS